MTEHDSIHRTEGSDPRWLAHRLGDLDPAERERLERERPGDPDDARAWERLVHELQAWAVAPMDTPPADLAALGRAIDRETVEAAPAHPARRRWSWAPPALAWTMAAAALLLLAFAQVSFTLRWGNAEWSWGRPTPVETAATLPAQTAGTIRQMASAIEQLGDAVAEHDAWLASLNQETSRLAAESTQARQQLASWQQTESTTRYSDVSRLISLIQHQSLVFDNRLQTLASGETRPANQHSVD